ncbi:MAG: hypothetical protein IKP72_06675 [Clostridia bacterium]|nr:hypothetical protein [Clostridia bacterium]
MFDVGEAGRTASLVVFDASASLCLLWQEVYEIGRNQASDSVEFFFSSYIYDTQNEWRERLLSVFVHFIFQAAFHIKSPPTGRSPWAEKERRKGDSKEGEGAQFARGLKTISPVSVFREPGEGDARHGRALSIPKYLTPARRTRQETRLSTKGMFFSFWSRGLRIFCPKRKDAEKTGVLILFFGYFPFFAEKQCLPPLRTAAGGGPMKRRVYLALGV